MLKGILATIAILVALTGVGFASGEVQAVYNRTVGVDVSSSETDQFHESKGYVDGMVQDLSKYELELNETKDVTAREAIINHVNQEFANFNANKITNNDLQEFLLDCRNGVVK